MSKKCPHCGSYNTEPAYLNYVGRALINTGRGVLSLGVAMIGGVLSPSAARGAGYKLWQQTDPGEFKGHHCCECDIYFK